MMKGSAAGSTIIRKICRSLAPKAVPMSTIDWLRFLTPAKVLMMTMNTESVKTMTTFETRPTPNQRMNSGINAIDGVEYSAMM